MATVFKTFQNNDINSTRTLLHESIPLTGTIVSGTYGGASVALGSEPNIKNYSHGMFQSVYDYPYLSSSANHIFDLTVGMSTGSALSASTTSQQAKKVNLYNQMAGTLMGYDANGNVIRFDQDGDIAAGGNKINDAIFINFARLLQKDEIKKGSFSIVIGVGDYATTMTSLLTITDNGAENNYRTNASVGDYAILSCSVGGGFVLGTGSNVDNGLVGLLFYQAGVAVLTSSLFMGTGSGGGVILGDVPLVSGKTADDSFKTETIEANCNAFRNRINDISFNNTTELNSTVHFCRINNNEFNYSANPTYVSSSKLVVKNTQLDAPVSYFTTVGLYSADNELLAVAKLSEPLKKDPSNEMIVRVRLDY